MDTSGTAMLDLTGAMMMVMAAWLLLSLTFIGLGLSFFRILQSETKNGEKVFECFWIGWAITLTFLQVWSIFFAVNHWPFMIATCSGAAGLIWNRRAFSATFLKASRQKFLCLALLLVFIWLANRAIGAPWNGDSGLYHFSSVRWAQSYAAVPGLGNLHGRLAYNQSYFLYVAMLDIGPFAHRSQHLANGILLFMVLAQILSSWKNVLAAKTEIKPEHIFLSLLLLPCIWYVQGPNVASPSPDLPVSLLQIVLSWQFLSFLTSHPPKDKALPSLVAMAFIAAIGITVKLSLAFLGIATIIVATVIWCRGSLEPKPDAVLVRHTLSLMAILVLSVLIPWTILGIITSGYIAYPCSFLSMPVDWLIPHTLVVNEANWICSWARQPGVPWTAVLSNNDWLYPWAQKTFADQEIWLPTTIALLAIFAAIVLRLGPLKQSESGRMCWLFLVPSLAGLTLWFLSAPAPRFAGASFWILASGLISLDVLCLGHRQVNTAKVLLCISILGICRFTLLIDHPLGRQTAGVDQGFQPAPVAELTQIVTRSGLTVSKPKADLPWDAPLPCTPYVNLNLRQRKPGDLGLGFVIDSQGADSGTHL